MGSLQTVMSPQLLAAEAFLVMKPQRIRWKGWPESGDCVHHFGNTWTVASQICQWLFLRFITVGESMKQESQSADYVGWTRRSALQPRPHSSCRTAWGRSLLGSGGPPGTGGSRESSRSLIHTAGRAGVRGIRR